MPNMHGGNIPLGYRKYFMDSSLAKAALASLAEIKVQHEVLT